MSVPKKWSYDHLGDRRQERSTQIICGDTRNEYSI